MSLPPPILAVLNDFSGPVPEAIGIVAVGAAGVIFTFSEHGSMQRKGAWIIFGLAITFSSISFVPPLFGYPGAAVVIGALMLALLTGAAVSAWFLFCDDDKPNLIHHNPAPRPVRAATPPTRPAPTPRTRRTKNAPRSRAAEAPVKHARKTRGRAHPPADRWKMPPSAPLAAPSSSLTGLPLDPSLDETIVPGLFSPAALSDIETWTGIDDADETPDPDVATADHWLRANPRPRTGLRIRRGGDDST